MAKRSSVVILSSDEEEDAKTKGFRSRLLRSAKPSSITRASSSAPRSSKPAKKARRSGPRSAPPKEHGEFAEFKSLFEDFAEDFAEFKVSAGLRNTGCAESWIEKHRPRNLEELAVHKKKVEDVRAWLEDRLRLPKKQFSSHVLLITGPAGVGKSATVQVLASSFGAELFEWDTPTPTIWQEHVHNSISGVRYISKLDEFENFVERVRKFGILPSSSASSSRAASIILLIDDLPLVNGKISYRRLLKCLQVLSKSVQMPTVIVVTDYGGAESGDNNGRRSEELWASLEITGAHKVVFNPITVNSIKKVLSRICRQEQCNVSSEEIDSIANASEGDIRNAIQSLQYLLLNPRASRYMSAYGRSSISSEGRMCDRALDHRPILTFGRDQTLSLFHALGKFLHNKRDTEDIVADDQHAFSVREGFSRLPLKMDAPEKVLCQAYGQARQVAEFLHENVPDFIGEEFVEDAWAVASYLSDADCLLSSSRLMLGASYRAENIAQSVAASVSVRGVLFGNAHPSASRWHAIRKPRLWQVEKSVRHNKFEMEKIKSEVHGLGASGLSIISTEYRPMLKWLGYRATASSLHPDDESDKEYDFSSEPGHSDSTDDDIKDC